MHLKFLLELGEEFQKFLQIVDKNLWIFPGSFPTSLNVRSFSQVSVFHEIKEIF